MQLKYSGLYLFLENKSIFFLIKSGTELTDPLQLTTLTNHSVRFHVLYSVKIFYLHCCTETPLLSTMVTVSVTTNFGSLILCFIYEKL